ncbi:zinc ABC transporter substrate-binding protein [Pelagibacterium sediminicola]|uniref:zinc ABC transporter substrate-binding protein n=1 Tax=Pelagibacterium sediminicola TaxID=2248761 RepID=UPI000E312EA3|nr:zinc ABC transporter substrate-binding protein [Pelagibacterium sediminicola]
MSKTTMALVAPAIIALFAASPALGAPNVVASVKPLHSLVAAVMDGVGTPELLVEGAASPHGFSLRPSDAAKLESADIVFWIGEDLETFLPGPLSSLAGDAKIVEMMDQEGMTILGLREGGLFEAHSHDHEDREEHDHADHDGHDHGHEGHNHEHEHDHGHDDHGHDHSHDDHPHEHGDGHIWLDPQNARLMVAVITDTLIAADPDNGETYNANGQAVAARIDALQTEIDAALAPVRGKPFFVFHDAYHYFEARFDIEATGTFTVNPEIAPGAARLTEIRERVEASAAACLFAEPQFSPAVIETIAEGTSARVGVLDPLGAEIENGPGLYPTLLSALADSLIDCLAD